MKNVIITGGTGFIGKWLVLELIKYNISVTMLVRNKSKIESSFNENVIIIEYDPNNMNAVANILKEEYDVFFHLGWGGVFPEDKNDINIQTNNIIISIEAIKLANRLQCKKFIGAGTVAEYVFSKKIIDFKEKQTPNDVYGAAKVATHYMLEAIAKQLNQNFVWVVLPSTFGEGRIGQNIITYTIQTLLKHEKPQYGKLEQMWDFLYVSEVARALRLIGEKGKSGKAYGIGSGIYRPLKDYIIEIRDCIDINLPLGIGDKEESSDNTISSCVNIDELQEDTGFYPMITFNEGILKTIKSYNI